MTMTTPNGFADFVPDGMREECAMVANELLVAFEALKPILERAHEVHGRADQVDKAAYGSAEAAGLSNAALDGANAYFGEITGATLIHTALSEIHSATDPDAGIQ